MAPKKVAASTAAAGSTAPNSPSATAVATAGTLPGSNVFAPVIDYIIWLCDFPEDSTMVKFIEQQGWTKLIHVTTIGIDEVKDFYTVKDDGMTFEAKPMLIHVRLFKAFLLFYKRKSREVGDVLTEENLLSLSQAEFHGYCCSDDYTADLVAGGLNPRPTVAATSGPIVGAMDTLTVQEFRRGVKRDKTHYEDLKDDKYFSSWDRGFVATARMHHTHLILDEAYTPKDDMEAAVFNEIQVFMYAVLEEHLKTDKGKSLVSQYEKTHDAQGIYRDLKKHAMASTAAQLSGDTLLQYITTARYPGNWRGTTYGFVLHWKEQVVKYERLELEPFPPKQKLRMLQNAVGDVTELAYVKQIGDQDIARGNPPLTYESYMELLLSACSTYDKKITLPGKQKRAVYSSTLDDKLHDQYEVYHVDTDISEIMVNTVTLENEDGSTYGHNKSKFIPKEDWDKLSPEDKERLISKRRLERMGRNNSNRKPYAPPRRANVHDVEEMVDLDNLVDYTAMIHEIGKSDDEPEPVDDEEDDALLAYMAGRKSASGDIRHVLAAKSKPVKKKSSVIANETVSTPTTVQVGDTTYHLNKGETITFQGRTYSAHVTRVHYRIGQHDVVAMDKALVDRGANGGICGDDMLVTEGSE